MDWAKYIIVASIAICSWACGGAPTKSATEPQNSSAIKAQRVVIDNESLQQGASDTLRFGKMRQGEIVEKRLCIENHSDMPLVILRHVTSCGCTTANYERKPIATGESATINFEFNSRGEIGWQMKLMEFYFADKGTPLKIYIEAEVD